MEISHPQGIMSDVVYINSENAAKDQWKLLAQYAYPTNIVRYLRQLGFADSEKLVEYIAGCFRQSEAYFGAAENSPIDISPLLQYYGAATLLAGTSAMISGAQLPIREHGMTLNASNIKRIADAQIIPRGNGALHQFAGIFSQGCSFVNGKPWTMEEILGSIPDLKQDFESCYQGAVPYTIPIEIVKRNRGSLERIAIEELERFKAPEDALANIENLLQSYLIPEYTNQYIILHRKIKSPEIGTYSLFGQKHLQMAHSKKGQKSTPNQVIIMFMSMFSLGFLSRYHPEFWNSFVRSDETGELLLVEKFIAVCQRYFPNLVLNEIQKSRLQFVNKSKGILDLSIPSSTDSDKNSIHVRGISKRDMT